jgi:hypothetical protein
MTQRTTAELVAIAADPTFYVEARVGSANHRGECCRALWKAAGCNERADEVIRQLATAYIALWKSYDGLRMDNDLLRAELRRMILGTPLSKDDTMADTELRRVILGNTR